jgi:hypothetical protein
VTDLIADMQRCIFEVEKEITQENLERGKVNMFMMKYN